MKLKKTFGTLSCDLYSYLSASLFFLYKRLKNIKVGLYLLIFVALVGIDTGYLLSDYENDENNLEQNLLL